tara:strand:+ start:3063 stop:3980 length:918 start_codon:yes stop_codon:yes gene_type:complete
MPVKKIEVNEDNSGRRLDNFLLSIYKNVPKSKIYNIIRKGEVRINSGRIKPHRKIETGDLIRIPPYLDDINDNQKTLEVIPKLLTKQIKENIIYEDNNYLVLNKPAGIAVHGGTKSYIGIISIMRSLYNDDIDLCHRIDKETSGCLVLSKNKKSNKHFNNLLVSKDISKKYIAILKGHLKKTTKVEALIDKSFDTETKSFISEKGKISSSVFKPLTKLNKSCLVEIEIFTGRTHQIRVQSSHIGHPVVNDDKYGDRLFNKIDLIKKTNRMALHALEIKFKDQNNKTIKVRAETDNTFNKLLDLLK